MNRDELLKTRDKLTYVIDSGRGEAYHDYLRTVIDAIVDDDPPAKIDTTLRGWVMVMDGAGREFVWWAFSAGVAEDFSGVLAYTWDDMREMGWTVRALTPEDIGYKVRRWDEWTSAERDMYNNRFADTPGHSVDLAIDIATRGHV